MGDTSGCVTAAITAAKKERKAQTRNFLDEEDLMSMSFFDAPTDNDWLLSMPALPPPAPKAPTSKAKPVEQDIPAPKRPKKAGHGASPAEQDS